jgi:predicted nucleic acid-binding protein
VPLYLADTSIWAWANKRTRPDIAEKLASRLERDEIATCVPVVLEVMHRAENGTAYRELYENLFGAVRWIDLTAEASRRALEVQRALAGGAHGNHRRPASDYLIAALAEAGGEDVVTWAFDRDFEVICAHTGQRFEAEHSTGAGH